MSGIQSMGKWGVLIVVGLIALGVVQPWNRAREPREPSASLLTLIASDEASEGFARATEAGAITFPDDLGAHPDYQIEWWYYTGNLQTAEGRPFGYQLTFFRRGLAPGEPERASTLAANSIYLAHFALTDGAANTFYDFERFQRAGALAGGASAPYRVWLDDWEVREIGPGSYQMEAQTDEIAISFTLTDLKGPILQGDRGLSPKGGSPGNASYYYSQTRLETAGEIRVGGQQYQVSGLSWKDHEYSTSALEAGAVGWDWFGLHLADGREIMFGQVRAAGGEVTFADGTLVAADGSTQRLSQSDVQLVALSEWSSPETGIRYPATWQMRIPSAQLDLLLEPLIADQELQVSATYWEGAVTITESGGTEEVGQGYVELTGYDSSEFRLR